MPLSALSTWASLSVEAARGVREPGVDGAEQPDHALALAWRWLVCNGFLGTCIDLYYISLPSIGELGIQLLTSRSLKGLDDF